MLQRRPASVVIDGENHITPARAAAAVVGLSAKERDVIRGLAGGRAPKQLAAEGGVSLATIRLHIRTAKRKTSARTVVELVAITTRVAGSVPR